MQTTVVRLSTVAPENTQNSDKYISYSILGFQYSDEFKIIYQTVFYNETTDLCSCKYNFVTLIITPTMSRSSF
jgi:hypothetical protein